VERIVLGTVQFGLPYGVSHHGGAVPGAEVADILALARASGIRTLDTAAAYGDSERVLGELGDVSASFETITKTVPIRSGNLTDDDVAAVDDGFRRSLSRLNRDRVAALLVHDARDLLGHGGERLWALMEHHRAEGRAERIGVSVYDTEEIEAVLTRFPVELVQLPLSVFDQRLVEDGTLDRLVSRGISVHARSLLLQGLLLMQPDEVPETLSAAVPLLTRWKNACVDANVTRLEAALAFALAQPIEGLVIGVHSRDHLAECLAATRHPVSLPWPSFACRDSAVIDPRRWRQ
jgi:aryl-alcohol dehydrogenase-like predicted oxidoreductase